MAVCETVVLKAMSQSVDRKHERPFIVVDVRIVWTQYEGRIFLFASWIHIWKKFTRWNICLFLRLANTTTDIDEAFIGGFLGGGEGEEERVVPRDIKILTGGKENKAEKRLVSEKNYWFWEKY